MRHNGNLNLYNKGGSGAAVTLKGTFDFHTGAYSGTSDRRLKEEIRDFDLDVEQFSKLRPMRYEYISDVNNKEHIGFIAQDLEKVYPEFVVKPDNEDDMYTVNYAGLSVVAIAAIQKQQTIIEQQKQILESQNEKIARLEKEHAAQEARMAQIEATLASLVSSTTASAETED